MEDGCYTKDFFTLEKMKSELELRKRVADLEEENRSIKQRLERIEMMFWQQQQQFMSIHQQPMVFQGHAPRLQQHQQPYLVQKDVQQQRLQAVGSLLPPQNVTHQSQRTLPEMPSTLVDAMGNVNGGDWQELVFQKINSMKEMYLADLTEIHRKVTAKFQLDSLPDQQRSERFEKLKKFKEMMERMLQFLFVSKRDITPELRDKVDYYETQIIGFLNMHRPRKAQEQK
ncbi:unnamed protein product [Microthlaspi erraticum]|uniref:Mediator complex subunit 15 KIX domain-containing protein n=1 Tax=Microthlaspi erraticum TaxID=1685480 RepID=A0A6D2I876_9BRAS|nr:unnamed protein product [Microthlaspi erraticum]